MIRFAKGNRISRNEEKPFLQEYFEVVPGGPEKTAEWLFDNYSRMNQEIFLTPGWDEIDPLELLVMRASSPKGVFTSTAKGAFLANIQKNQQLRQVAEATFGTSDADFLMNLPNECKQYRPKLKALMQIAYDKGIRTTDPNIIK